MFRELQYKLENIKGYMTEATTNLYKLRFISLDIATGLAETM
jgi:hypothetical protein